MYRRIRDLREDRDMTQAQMGRILACSQRVYSNYERGDLDIPTAVLIRLADYLRRFGRLPARQDGQPPDEPIEKGRTGEQALPSARLSEGFIGWPVGGGAFPPRASNG